MLNLSFIWSFWSLLQLKKIVVDLLFLLIEKFVFDLEYLKILLIKIFCKLMHKIAKSTIMVGDMLFANEKAKQMEAM